VIDHFQIADVRFAEVSARLVNDAPPDGSLGYEANKVEALYVHESKNHRLHVVLPFVIVLGVTPTNGPKQPLAEVRVSLVVTYIQHARESAPTEEEIAHYAGVSGLMHGWPYLRAETQSLTTKLGLVPLVLPVMISGQAAERVTISRLKPASRGTPQSAEKKRRAPPMASQRGTRATKTGRTRTES